MTSDAQEIHGIAHIAGIATPLPEASVVLIGAAGTVVAGAITDTGGSYILRASRQGTYRARAAHRVLSRFVARLGADTRVRR
ncbi:MAG: hypothetical protein ACR2MQ_01125 [Gemmatimonadaceae bacterium]